MATNTDPVYQALNPRNRRRYVTSRVRPEDALLTQSRRQSLAANSLDVWRNLGLFGWAIRRTLDYCCLWDFQPRTGDDGLNRDLKFLMQRDCEPEAIDTFGRMDWDDFRRVAEAQKLLSGDMFFVKLNDGTLQAVEGSYCVDPIDKKKGDVWVSGAKLKSGRVVAWNFAEEDNYGKQQHRSVRAGSVWQHCQFEGRPNQIRPQSPVVAALNEFRDVDETFDHMRAKVKLDQMFGLAFGRKADSEALGDPLDADAGDETQGSPRVVDFGDGPAVFDLDEGEEVTPIQSTNPASNTQDFLKLCIQIALKSLDLPFNFFDEAYTNFFGSRAAWLLFERACHARRKTQDRLHRNMTTWRLWRWVLSPEMGGTGELVLPSGMLVQDVRFRWVPRGIAWWRPQEELDTALRSVAAGLKSMQDVCDEHGFGDYRENLAEIVAEREELARYGLIQQWSQNAMVRLMGVDELAQLTAPQPSPVVIPVDDPDETEEEIDPDEMPEDDDQQPTSEREN